MFHATQDLTGPWKLLHKSLQLHNLSIYLGTHHPITSPAGAPTRTRERDSITQQRQETAPNEEGET